MKLKVTKGVLSKDGTPYAAGTIHAVKGGWSCPYHYSIASLCLLLVDREVKSISIIDEENRQMDLTDLRESE